MNFIFHNIWDNPSICLISHVLVGGLEPWNFMTVHILGMSSSQLTNSYFFRGLKPPTSNHIGLVGGFKHFVSIISGIILPIDFHIFQDGLKPPTRYWRFPKMRVARKIIHVTQMFHYEPLWTIMNHPAVGVPPLMETPIWREYYMPLNHHYRSLSHKVYPIHYPQGILFH